MVRYESLFDADVGSIDLDDWSHTRSIRLPNPLNEEPGGLLGDTKLSASLT